MSADRMVDGYGGHTHIGPDSTLREEIMQAMCDSPLIGNFGYLHEYEAVQVTWILSREVFKIHKLLRYMDSDRDTRFLGVVWKDLNRSTNT